MTKEEREKIFEEKRWKNAERTEARITETRS